MLSFCHFGEFLQHKVPLLLFGHWEALKIGGNFFLLAVADIAAGWGFVCLDVTYVGYNGFVGIKI